MFIHVHGVPLGYVGLHSRCHSAPGMVLLTRKPLPRLYRRHGLQLRGALASLLSCTLSSMRMICLCEALFEASSRRDWRLLHTFALQQAC